MSSDPPDAAAATPRETTARIVYSREFLLSVGRSEVCRKLPPGIEPSVLSELQEALPSGVAERGRGHYGVPLGRADGMEGSLRSGRWDVPLSGSSNRDGILPERELFPLDRRSANQYRHNWQSTEHDGLLGNGALRRPSGFVGPLASNDRWSGYQLNRSSDRYQPPCPYKNDIDSKNDETFGSFEYSNEDRAEEERKRRASFELMRKEQHKALQEKKNTPDNEKENLGDDIISLLQNSAEKTVITTKSGKPDKSAVQNTTKTCSVLPISTTRPLVPPGFSNALVEKKRRSQSSNTSLKLEARNATTKENFPTVARFGGQAGGNQSARNISTRKTDKKGVSDNIDNLYQKHELPSLSEGVITSAEYASGILNVGEDWEDDARDSYAIEKEGYSTNKNSVRKDNSVSILEQFLGGAQSKTSGSLPTYAESQHPNTDEDIMGSFVPESSKFALWFHDEDLKPAEDLSSKSLLSTIFKGENLGPENIVPGPSASGGTFENLSPRLPTNNFDAALKLSLSSSSAPAVGILEQYAGCDIPEPVPVIMTCEDLEQTMVAEVGGTSSSSSHQNPVEEHQTVLDERSAAQNIFVDSHASKHLLSFLQKGASSNGSSPLGFHIGSADELPSSDLNGMVHGGASGTAPVYNAETVPTTGECLTFGAYLGAVVMNDHYSMNSQVSVQGSAAGGLNCESHTSSSQRLPSAESGKTLFSSSPEKYHPDEQLMLPFSCVRDGAAPKEPGTKIEYRNHTVPVSNHNGASFDEKGLEIQLPGEDNLFTVNDSLDVGNPDLLLFVKSGKVEGFLPEKAVDNLNRRFQNLVPGGAEHIQVLGPHVLGSQTHDQHDQVDSQSSLYHIPQGRPSAQAPHPPNSANPVFPPMDHVANRDQRVLFNMPETIHRGPQHYFPPNMNPMQHALRAPGGPQFDLATHHHMPQHMPMPGNFPSQFPPQSLPRGVPPSQPMHHMPGYRTEMSNVKNFRMHPRQHSYGEFGMTLPGSYGPKVGGNRPEELEGLIQMDPRARPADPRCNSWPCSWYL